MINSKPKDYKMTSYGFYKMCYDNKLFTCGSNRQYKKVMDMVDDGKPLKDIILLTWFASNENFTEQDIREMIESGKYDY